MKLQSLHLSNKKEIEKYYEKEEYIRGEKPDEVYITLDFFFHKSDLVSAVKVNIPNSPVQPVYEVCLADAFIYKVCGQTAQRFIESHFTD
jgi:hypothetical protein